MQVRLNIFRTIIILISVGTLVYVANTKAQTNQDALNQVRRAIQLEEQRRTEERRQLDEAQRTHSTLPDIESTIAPEIPGGGPCFTVNTIEVDGATLFSRKTIAETYSSLINTCISIADINALVTRLTQLYIDAGYVTSRAYIPQQNLSSGELIIKIVEGYVESLRIENGPQRIAVTAFPGLIGKPLNLRQIEQGLDQLNRLRSASATIQFVPGKTLGATEVVVRYKKSAPINISLGYNNSGQESTGLYKVNAGMGWDNPLGINDFIYLNHTTNARDEAPGTKSQSTSLHYSLPFGYWNFSLDANQFEYANIITGSATSFETRGNNDVLQISIDRLLARNQNSKTVLSLHLKEQSSENFIDDVLLVTSSRDNSVLGLNLSRDIYLPGSKTLLLSLGYDHGLKATYSSENAEQLPDSPQAKFDKYLLDITLMGAVQWLGNVWQWRTELHGQYSDDLLYSSESFAIGSQYTVRGFKEDGLSDDSGIYWRNEVSLPSHPFRRAPRVRVEPFVGLDSGIVNGNPSKGNESLTGWATGLRMSGTNVSAQIAYAQPLDYPAALDVEPHALDFSLTFSKSW